MLRVAVCVSGGGTNLQAILDRIQDGTLEDVEIVAVISNNANAYALERAKQHGIDGVCISPKAYDTRVLFEEAFLKKLLEINPDLIVLAGFLVNITPEVIRAFAGRIINIHPSLIPSFCGQGYYGLKVHEGVLERGVQVTGATVHYVDEGIDTGAIIMQQAVLVEENDTPKQLQERVMKEAEWVILPRAIRQIARNHQLKQSKD